MNPFEQSMKRVPNNVPKIIKTEDLHCDKCDRNYTLATFEDGSTTKVGCDCEMIALAKKQKENHFKRIQRNKANKIFSKSLVNQRTQLARLDNYLPETDNLRKALNAALRYVEIFDKEKPFSLYFHGTYGTGKTHLAYGIAHELKEKGYTVLFMNVAQLMSLIRSSYDKKSDFNELEIKSLINDVDLMVFDDIGVSESNHSLENLFEIIEMRLGKHNIYTTNLTAAEMSRDKKWQRIFSRIIGESHRFDMNGDDYRMKGIQNDS